MAAWQRLDSASDSEARHLLATCCGSREWVERMLAQRPFGSDARLATAARDTWFALTPDDWKEAFRHHPKIGDRAALAARFLHTAHLSADEQRGVDDAAKETLDALANANRRYEQRFGIIFIVCATGKTAETMLGLIGERLANDPETEIGIAAEEQAKITELRLRRL